MSIVTKSIQLPKSPVNDLINFCGVLAFVFAIFYCRSHGIKGVIGTLISVSAYGAAILFLEAVFLRTPCRVSTGLDFSVFHWDPIRVFTKVIGLYGCYAFIAFLYWGFPIYSGKFFNDYFYAIKLVVPDLLIVAIPYVAFVDGFMKKPEDNYYGLGCLLLLRPVGTSWRALGQLLLGWVVKAFFLPMMFVFMINNINYLVNLDLTKENMTFIHFFHPAVKLIFVLDLLAAVAGYALTLRLFDTHIRSAEPTFFGWFVCLLCYDPFNDTYMSTYIGYRGWEGRWIEWLKDFPELTMVWGSIVMFFIFTYSIASINFGVRFSNITHRGVLTNGMYRLTKHPAYISKNIFWWMTFVPFVTLATEEKADFFETSRFMLMILGVNLVYFLRARTEEKHMSRDPVYVQYALWMNEHGVFAVLGRMIPFFQYKAPHDWESLPPVYTGIH